MNETENDGTVMNALYLASQSPRRFELLQQIGYAPLVLLPDPAVDEATMGDEPARPYVIRLARTKAEAGEATRQARGLPSLPLLAADTTVTLDGHILDRKSVV